MDSETYGHSSQPERPYTAAELSALLAHHDRAHVMAYGDALRSFISDGEFDDDTMPSEEQMTKFYDRWKDIDGNYHEKRRRIITFIIEKSTDSS